MENLMSDTKTLTTGITIFVILVIIISLASALPLILRAFKTLGSLSKGQQESARLLSQGKDAVAKVTGLNDTGKLINYQPIVNMQLEVNDGSRTYPVQIETIVPQIKLPQVQPGMQVAVKVDPQDPNKVVLNLA